MRKRMEKGFTLVELLITVAIIAVLAAIAIPMFTSSLEDARAATCLANRTALQHEVTYAVQSASGSQIDQIVNQFSSAVLEEKGYVCPDKDGTITLSYDVVSHTFSVYCTKHGGLDVSYDLGSTVSSLIGSDGKGGLAQTIVDLLTKKNTNKVSQVDSTAPAPNNYAAAIQSRLEELTNHTLGAGMTTTWSISNLERDNNTLKNTYQVYWSSEDISSYTAGNQILVMQYNASSNTYSVGKVTVKTNTDKSVGGGASYNIIQPSTFAPIEGASEADFLTCYNAFQTALASASSGS